MRICMNNFEFPLALKYNELRQLISIVDKTSRALELSQKNFSTHSSRTGKNFESHKEKLHFTMHVSNLNYLSK